MMMTRRILLFTCRATVVKSKITFWVKAVKKTIRNCESPATTTVANIASYQRAELFVISALMLLLPAMKLLVGRQ